MAAEAMPGAVLVFAPIGRDGPTTAAILQRAGLLADVRTSFDDFLDGLDARPAAVFVAEEGLFGKALDRLWAWAARQEAWSDLPFVVLTSRHDQARVTNWRHGLVQRLGNVSLLERPVAPLTLVSVMQAAVRGRRHQLQVRELLAERTEVAEHLEALVMARTAELQQLNERLRQQMQEREFMEESLRHSQKLEALGQLTGGVAHDFNNLLMVITAGLDMIEVQADPGRRERMLQGMRQAAQRGASLTRQLLAFSRRHALRPETVDLARHMQEMRDLLDRSLGGDVQVEVQLAPGLWPVEVDPGELELVLLNLAVNARDAMAGGGTIRVSGENRSDLDEGGLQGDFVAVSVGDNGSGMSEEVKARVFEPFFTTKDVGKGSGLGLAQVYGFARQSGGQATVDSQVGVGTTITLLLPRARGQVRTVAAPLARAAPVGASASGCVLMVEDDAEVAALVSEMLRELGYDVVHAGSAQSALGALADARKVDFVFSDIMMPGGTSGIDLAREVRKRRPGLPILLTSGFAERSRKEAGALGVPVLSKPYSLQDLRAAVAGAMEGHGSVLPTSGEGD